MMSKKILVIISALVISILLNSKQNNLIAQQPKGFELLTFLSVNGDKIINEKGSDVKLRGFHYDAFYVITKQIYFASKQNRKKIDEYNTELSKYFFNDNDIKEIKNIGANVVRIGFRLWQIEKESYTYSEESLKHLDDTHRKIRGKRNIRGA